MLLTSQNLFSDSPSRFSLYFSRNPSRSFPIALSQHLSKPAHLHILKLKSLNSQNLCSFKFHRHLSHLKVYESEGVIRRDAIGDFNFDYILSFSEFFCLFSSAMVSVCFAVNSVVPSSKREFFIGIGNRVFPWGILMLVGGVVIGAWIRRRQWRRVCRETAKGGLEVNLLERIEKLEEDLRSSATIIRVLSRQIEKLGIRFRVTRKALKEPIAETAALAQKNSEATRALAMQEDILEKELGEIQKVLLAMQEQQQKQLELILAIGKTSKLRESGRETNGEQDKLERHNPAEEELKQKETQKI
ncbi:Transmembrane protein [Quillaja saponaria]|uniref:Transmembrane protein n=1 Tax=Quillaja saponaria TaxID=32244 RepID=A0AAD7KTE9_QUISA|nr:Transmembrane protein [Quillaja saponaria]